MAPAVFVQDRHSILSDAGCSQKLFFVAANALRGLLFVGQTICAERDEKEVGDRLTMHAKAFLPFLVAGAVIVLLASGAWQDRAIPDTADDQASGAPATNVIDPAYQLCRIVYETGLATDTCRASSWRSEVTARVDIAAEEGAAFCVQVAGRFSQQSARFSRAWTLHVHGPGPDDDPIASCEI